MAVFSVIFFKILSALLSVIVGFLAGKLFSVERDSIASLLFYFVTPIVFFAIPASTTLTLSAISIVCTVFVLCSIMCFATYYLSGFYWQDKTRNVLALSAGTSNCGYFMLPLATTLFDDYTLSLYMMAVVGVAVYESSIGFYVCARSFSSTRDSIKRVLKLPNLNAFILGCIVSLLGITLPDFLDDFIYNMRSTYSVIGMIMIGIGVSTIKKFEIDVKFALAAVGGKCILQPIIINSFILLDKWVLHLYNGNDYYQALQLLSTAPMSSNVIVIASFIKFHPEHVATAVLVSAIVDLFYIPFMVSMVLTSFF